jgi:hypothetical protein
VLAFTAASGNMAPQVAHARIQTPERLAGRGGLNAHFTPDLNASMAASSESGSKPEDDQLRGDPLQGSKHATLNLSLDARYAFASRLPQKVRHKLDKTQTMEHLFESRVASFERYVSMLVMFHAMAESASKPWLLPAWDIARSQSNLRVATTACPVSVEEDALGETEDLASSAGINDAAFNESKHMIQESKARVGGRDVAPEEFFPVSTVTLEDDNLSKVGGAKRNSSNGDLYRSKALSSIPKDMNELDFVKPITGVESVGIGLSEMGGGGGGIVEEDSNDK